MDVKSSGIVTRSGRRLSTDKLEVDNSSVSSTPTKRRTRRLSEKPDLEDLPETDIIDKDEKSLPKTMSEPVKKEILALTISDTNSPSRNLRKRNVSLSSPKETKPTENAIPKNAVRKIESSLMQNIVDSPKMRKNKRLSGSDMEGFQDVSLRRSRRLSGELNVVLEDPIREDQDSSKVNSNRRGRRLTIMPEHPTLHEECEDVEESSQTGVKVEPSKDLKSPQKTDASNDNSVSNKSQENTPKLCSLSINLERSEALIFSTSEILDDSSNENFRPKCFSPISPKLHVGEESEVRENTPQKKTHYSSMECSQIENDTLFDNTNYGSQHETPVSIKKRFSDIDSKSSEKKKLRKSEESTHSENVRENIQEEEAGDSSSLNMSSNDVSLEDSKQLNQDLKSNKDDIKNEESELSINTSQRKSPRLSGRISTTSPKINMNSSKTKCVFDDCGRISSPKQGVVEPKKDDENSLNDSTAIDGLNTSGKNVIGEGDLVIPSSTKESDEVNFDSLSSPTNLNNSRKKFNTESSPVVILNNSRTKRNSESSPSKYLNNSKTGDNRESSLIINLNKSRNKSKSVSSPIKCLDNSMNDSGSSAKINLNISQEIDVRESSPMMKLNNSRKKANSESSPVANLNNSRIKDDVESSPMIDLDTSGKKDNTVSSPMINLNNSRKKNNSESSPMIDLNTSGKKDNTVSSPMINLNNSRKKNNRESSPMIDLNTSGKKDNTVSSPMINLNNSRKKNNRESSPMIDLNTSGKKDNTVSSPMINLNNSHKKNNSESSPMIDLNTSGKKDNTVSSPMINLNNSRKKNDRESSPMIDLNTSGKKDNTVSSPMMNNSRKKNNSEPSPMIDLNTSGKKDSTLSSPMINLNNSREKNNSESSPMIDLNTSGKKDNTVSSPMINLNNSRKKNNSESSPKISMNSPSQEIVEEESGSSSEPNSPQKKNGFEIENASKQNNSMDDFSNFKIKSTSVALKCDSQILYTGSSEKKDKMLSNSSDEELDSENDENKQENASEDNNSTNENEYLKLQLIDESASEAESDYKSGDSLAGSELEEMELNEIVEKGESLHSEDEEESDVSSYEKDSFICSDGEESDAASKSNSSDVENNLQNNIKETTKQTSEEWVVSSLDSPLKTYNGKDLNDSRKGEKSSEKKDGGWTSSAGKFKIVEKVVVEKPSCPITTSNYGSTTRFNIVTLKKHPKHILSMPPGLDNFKENSLYGNNVKRKDSKNYKIMQQKMKAFNMHK